VISWHKGGKKKGERGKQKNTKKKKDLGQGGKLPIAVWTTKRTGEKVGGGRASPPAGEHSKKKRSLMWGREMVVCLGLEGGRDLEKKHKLISRKKKREKEEKKGATHFFHEGKIGSEKEKPRNSL